MFHIACKQEIRELLLLGGILGPINFNEIHLFPNHPEHPYHNNHHDRPYHPDHSNHPYMPVTSRLPTDEYRSYIHRLTFTDWDFYRFGLLMSPVGQVTFCATKIEVNFFET